jgi:hypothetical protein
MRTRFTALAAIITFAVLQSPALARHLPASKPTMLTPPSYATPTAVFDAYRVAIATNDVATEMYCQVKEIREDAYQSYLCMGLAAGVFPASVPGMAAAIKMFGADKVADEYLLLFKAKPPASPRKLRRATKPGRANRKKSS